MAGLDDKIKVYLECVCGKWKTSIVETTVREQHEVTAELIKQAKKEHPEATLVAPRQGHYLKSFVNHQPDKEGSKFLPVYPY